MEQNNHFSIFLCGDVMTGRGIDQILLHPNHPQLYESYVRDARDYVYLAEKKQGNINYPVAPDYIWGDALAIWQSLKPVVKIINLETAITQSADAWPNKGIHYRMHPLNIPVLTAPGIDICTLANNHILDWGYEGLKETLKSLKEAGIQYAGAGENLNHAMQPAIHKLPSNKRILVFSAGTLSSGVPSVWQATAKQPGIFYISDDDTEEVERIIENIRQYKRPGDLIIFSIHWGSNWGYEISESMRLFAHKLIDKCEVDVIYGHSSHHPRPIEIYQGKPIFYGCGDFINDYEGIEGFEEYRGDLSLMYFLDFDNSSLQLKKITLIPLEIKNFRLNRVSQLDCKWMYQTINRVSFAEFILEESQFIKII